MSAADVEAVLDHMTESYVAAMQEGLDAQAAFVDEWLDQVETATDPDAIDEGSLRVYEAWMNAAEESFERLGDTVDDETFDPEEFRDVWLQAANEAFKETMSTTAFAAATGESVDAALDARRQVDEISEDTLHTLGFATTGDVREVGERLVETERRLHDVERKLDRVLDAVEE